MRGGERQEVDLDDESTRRVVYDLCSMIIHILHSPSLPAVSSPTLVAGQASPAAFASLFLGISVAMMLFGALAFFIGFFLMPLVVGLVMLFYLVGLIYNLSQLCRAILWPGYPLNSAAAVPGWRDVCEWNYVAGYQALQM